MNKTAYCLPLLLALAGGAQAQTQPDANAFCPQLAADSGLAWQHKATSNTDFCRALRSDGSEAFGLYIARESAFKPNRGNREERASIDGQEVTWYRSEIASKPDIQARETVLELADGRVAHIWVQATPEQLDGALQQAQAMRFQSARLSLK
ncbi:MAG: hypothetical protein ACYC42_08205 [Lysobacter sp.]